jgi:hypothetical protein
MEPVPGKRTGTLLLAMILVTCAVIAVAAYLGQGHMGIEERFSSALGLPGEEEAGEGAASPGIMVEGDVVMYGVIVLVLAGAAGLMYARYRV